MPNKFKVGDWVFEKGIKKTQIEYNILYANETGGNNNINLKSDLLFESKSKLLDTLKKKIQKKEKKKNE